jgi:hypothetical protein
MAEPKEEAIEEVANPLKGTFFDTFEFSPEMDEKKEEKPKDAEKNTEPPKDEDSEKNKEETKKEGKDETPPVVDEEIQAKIEATAEAIKAKDVKDLDDEEKQFLVDYEAGTLEDYVPPVKEEPKTETGFDTLAKDLIKEGILVETEELEDSVEGFNKVIATTVDAKVEEYLADIPDDYKTVIDHMRTGGTAESYLQQKQKINYDAVDYTNTAIQKTLVEALANQQGLTKEEIEERIVDLTDLEKMEKEARRAGKIFDKQQDKRILDFDKGVKAKSDALEKQEEDEVTEISDTIDKLDNVAGFKLTDKRREGFKKYLFELDEAGETAASRAHKTIENRIKLYFMDFINYDFKDLVKTVETKKTRDLSNILNRFTDKNTKSKGTVVKENNPNPEETFELKLPSMFDGPQSED